MPIPTLSIDPFDESILADPYPHHDLLRDAGPVFWLSSLNCFGMARFEQVTTALKDWETYISSRGVGLSDFAKEDPWRPPALMLEADPPIHTGARGLMNRIVTPTVVRAAFEGWHKTAAYLVDQMIERGTCDAVAELAEPLPLTIFPELVGMRDGGREHLLPYAAMAFNAFGPRNRLLQEAQETASASIPWVVEACQKENLKAGGLGEAVHDAAERSENLSESGALLVRSFFTAGLDTTINGIANMIHAFSCHPDQWAKLRSDRSLLKRAFEESLRWDSTAQAFFRTTSREVNIGGHDVPEGEKVMLFYAAANRDPRRWDRPNEFDISRNSSGHVAFGFGIHQCLGQMIARAEAEAVLTALIDRVAEIRPAGPVERRLNNTLRAVSKLPVELIPA